ncbi:MAG: MlaE family ABC transporter permease [Holophagaceae bacterium]
MKKIVELIGSQIMTNLFSFGDFIILTGRTVKNVFKSPFDFRYLIKQCSFVGVSSVPVVIMTSLAVSMVFAVQLAFGFKQFQAEGLASQVEGLAVIRELAPVITGLMISGRVGSAMAAELGTMRITEQIDALECLATDPIHYLFVPRFLAAIFMLPMLTILSIYISFWGGHFILVNLSMQSSDFYTTEFFKLITSSDLKIALIKSFVFGIIISLVGCWKGYRTEGGAVGVGAAPTSSVVTSSLWILIADFILTKLLLV